MSDEIILEAQTRKVSGKEVEKIRRNNMIPAVVYGHGVNSVSLAVGYQVFDKVYKHAGESSLVDLVVDKNKPVKALIQSVQRDPVTEKIIHVDFHQIKMTERISAEVKINFVGESKAVKEMGGILVKNLDKIKIECLPQDLINEIEVDISQLNTLDDIIRVKNLKMPDKVTIKDKPEDVVINVQEPRGEEELKELEEKVEEKVDDIERVEGKKEDEDEETEEGAESEKEKTDEKSDKKATKDEK